MCLLGQLYFGPISVQTHRPELLLCMHLRLLNQFHIQLQYTDGRFAFPVTFCPVWETLVTIVIPFHGFIFFFGLQC